MLEPRLYQRKAIEAVRDEWDEGRPNALIVLATGLGKTVIFSVLGRELRAELGPGRKILVLAHRSELLSQAKDKWLQVDPEAVVGIYQANRRETWADVICASIQSCYPDTVGDGDCDCVRRSELLGQVVREPTGGPDCVCKGSGTVQRVTRRGRVHDLPWEQIDLIVIDEAHHAPASTYMALLECARARNPRLVMLGVTATPFRADGKGLGLLWDRVAYRMGITEGIDQGFLTPLVGQRVELDVDLSTVRVSKSSGDFVDDDLGSVMDTPEARAAIVKAWLEHAGPGSHRGGAGGRPTAAFAPTVAAAKHLAEEFSAKGVRAEFLSGETPKIERAAILARYQAGETQVLTNCAVLTEGWDAPHTAAILIARPTKSVAMYAQMVGRGTRPVGGHIDASRLAGKTDCLVFDCVGASKLGLASLADLSVGSETKAKGIDDVEKPAAVRAAELEFPDEVERARVRGFSVYEVDLFSGAVAWGLVRGCRVASIDLGRSVVVYPAAGGLFTAIAITENAGKLVLAELVPEPEALKRAERYAVEHGKPKFLVPGDWFTKKPASDKQQRALTRLSRLNRELDARIGAVRPLAPTDLPPVAKMSMSQAILWLGYLSARLEWTRPAPTTVAA